MTVPANRLFAVAPIENLLSAIEQNIEKTIESMEPLLITNSGHEKIVKSLENQNQHKLNLPSLNRTDVHISDQEGLDYMDRYKSAKNSGVVID